jgi:hypothetical protein
MMFADLPTHPAALATLTNLKKKSWKTAFLGSPCFRSNYLSPFFNMDTVEAPIVSRPPWGELSAEMIGRRFPFFSVVKTKTRAAQPL